LWSKDIIFVIPPDSKAGPQAWVDAYHDTHQSPAIQSLPLKSGALQGAMVIDYPFDHRFESIHIVYDGINGQLPNLDLMNTVVSIASGQMGIGVSLQQMWHHSDSYKDRLKTMLRGMLNQGLGHASGPHSSFIPYHVDAITLQPFGNGWQDEMAMGRVIESTTRSLNNLLEHLHQSFFFYLLMQANRFVSIGTYLPSAMLVAVNFTIMAIFLWVRSGSPVNSSSNLASTVGPNEKKPLMVVNKGDAKALVPEDALSVRERELFLPLAVVACSQFLGLLPLYIFNHTPHKVSLPCHSLNHKLNFTDARNNIYYLCPRCRRPPHSLLQPSNTLLSSHKSTIPPHQILLPPPPRNVPLLTRHSQLLPRIPRRFVRHPINLYSTSTLIPSPKTGSGSIHECFSADYCFSSRVLVLGVGCRRGIEGGGLWMGCLGYEYAGCGLVCLVACLGCGSGFVVGCAKG
jgi:hypothetical protein